MARRAQHQHSHPTAHSPHSHPQPPGSTVHEATAGTRTPTCSARRRPPPASQSHLLLTRGFSLPFTAPLHLLVATSREAEDGRVRRWHPAPGDRADRSAPPGRARPAGRSLPQPSPPHSLRRSHTVVGQQRIAAGWSPFSSPQQSTAGWSPVSSPLRSLWRTAASSLLPFSTAPDTLAGPSLPPMAMASPAGGGAGSFFPSHLLV